jgi:ribosomal protein S27AE
MDQLKECFKCHGLFDVSGFYGHPQMASRLLGKCKECTKADVRANYRATKPQRQAYERERGQRAERKAAKREYDNRYNRAHKDRLRCHNAVNKAIMAGKLLRQPCSACGADPAQAHHDDYSKPLDVRWLCFVCHRRHHGQQP